MKRIRLSCQQARKLKHYVVLSYFPSSIKDIIMSLQEKKGNCFNSPLIASTTWKKSNFPYPRGYFSYSFGHNSSAKDKLQDSIYFLPITFDIGMEVTFCIVYPCLWLT